MDQKYEKTSEECLWSAFIDGNEESFQFIYRRYLQELYKYGCHLTGYPDLIQDCIQDIFIDLQQYRKRLVRTNDNIKICLFRSLKNIIIQGVPYNRVPGKSPLRN